MDECLRNHDILKIIFSFVGNGHDFRGLEKTCKNFNGILQDDEIWGFCPKGEYASSPKLLNKEIVLNEMLLKHVETWQEKDETILFSVLGLDGLKELIDGMMALALQHFTFPPGFRFNLRGDAVATLIHIIEDNALSQLDRAFHLSVHRHQESKSSVFPTVTKADFLLQDKLHNPNGTSSFSESIRVCPINRVPCVLDDESLPEGLRVSDADKQTIACRMAYRVGFVKMDQDVKRLLWTSLIKTSNDTLKQSLVETEHMMTWKFRRFYLRRDIEITPLPKRTIFLRQRETIRSVAPFPYLGKRCCPTCRIIDSFFNIVPRQIEDAAQRLRLPMTTTHANEWIVEKAAFLNADEQEVEEAVADAERHYNFNSCEDGTENAEPENDGENTKGEEEASEDSGEPAAKKRKVDSGPPVRLNSSESPSYNSENSESDEENSTCDNESDDDEYDGEIPEEWVDAALQWNPYVYRSCNHRFGSVPFRFVPDLSVDRSQLK